MVERLASCAQAVRDADSRCVSQFGPRAHQIDFKVLATLGISIVIEGIHGGSFSFDYLSLEPGVLRGYDVRRFLA